MACSVRMGTGHTVEGPKPDALPTYPATQAHLRCPRRPSMTLYFIGHSPVRLIRNSPLEKSYRIMSHLSSRVGKLHSPRTKSSPSSVFANKVLPEHSYAHFFTWCLWLLCGCQQRPYGPQSLKYVNLTLYRKNLLTRALDCGDLSPPPLEAGAR